MKLLELDESKQWNHSYLETFMPWVILKTQCVILNMTSKPISMYKAGFALFVAAGFALFVVVNILIKH